MVFEVQEGDSSSAIGRNLKAAGVVASVEAFTEAAADDPDAQGSRSASTSCSKKMSAEAALECSSTPATSCRAR